MQVIKRNGTTQSFDWDKIENVIRKAFEAVDKTLSEAEYYDILDELYFGDENGVMRDSISVEELQDQIEQSLFICGHFDVMKAFQDAGFKLKELIIKEQHNCKATGYWKTNSVKYNFLLIAHEYLFVFKK